MLALFGRHQHQHSPILDEVGPVGDDDGGEDGLGPGVVVGQVGPHTGYRQPEHVVQLPPVHAAGHLVLHQRLQLYQQNIIDQES